MVDPSGLQIVTAFRFGRARGVGQAGGAPPGGRERRRLCSFSFGGPGPVADWDYRAQSSEPCTPSSAENSSVVPTTVSDAGEELAGPGLMSSTSIVPAAVPSDVHSSWPWAEPSVAEKNTAEPSTIGGPIDEPPGPGLMSSTSIVPAAVPSEVHSSAPFVPSLAENSSEVPNATSESGLELSVPEAPPVQDRRGRGLRPPRGGPSGQPETLPPRRSSTQRNLHATATRRRNRSRHSYRACGSPRLPSGPPTPPRPPTTPNDHLLGVHRGPVRSVCVRAGMLAGRIIAAP